MGKTKGRRNMKSSFCIPRLRGNTNGDTNRLSSISLLDRLREAVFRLIMLSALSKPATQHTGPISTIPSAYYPPDEHHSEAVADCIEFIKKKSVSSPDGSHDSTTACSSLDDTEMVFSGLQVMR